MPLMHPMPDPVAIHLGPVAIHWYGLMYVLAFAMFIALGRVRIKQPHIAAQGWTKEDLDDMLFYGMLGVIVGGRLGEVFFYQPEMLLTPLRIFKVWEGGMSFHGGFLGVLIGMALWARKRKRNLLDVYDFIAPLVPLGYAAGRMGNFINAELPGRVVSDPNLPWAMIYPNVGPMPRHPSAIYQMLVDGILVFCILWPFAQGPSSPGGRRVVRAAVRLRAFLHRVVPHPGLGNHRGRPADHLRPDAVAADDHRRHHHAGMGLPFKPAR